MILVDTNVLVDLWTRDPAWGGVPAMGLAEATIHLQRAAMASARSPAAYRVTRSRLNPLPAGGV